MSIKRIMKYSLIGFALLMVLAVFVPAAMSADKVISSKVDNITTQIDKNGNEYTRIIVLEQKKVQGVEYESGVPVMAFGSLSAQVKTMIAGDILKAVVEGREYQGRTSYTLKAILSK